MWALVDREGTGRNVRVQKVLTGLYRPNGVAWRDSALFVAEAGQVTRFDNVDAYALAGQVWPRARWAECAPGSRDWRP